MVVEIRNRGGCGGVPMSSTLIATWPFLCAVLSSNRVHCFQLTACMIPAPGTPTRGLATSLGLNLSLPPSLHHALGEIGPITAMRPAMVALLSGRSLQIGGHPF